MALKGSRNVGARAATTDFFMNEVGQRGGVVSYSTVGSGDALDQSAALVTYAATGSGSIPLGILLCDMVNYDQTRQHINYYKDEVQKGRKVAIMTKGWVVTDQITSGITITAGDAAYVGNGGRITNVFVGGTHVQIGRFASKKDEDGYAKIDVNLP